MRQIIQISAALFLFGILLFGCETTNSPNSDLQTQTDGLISLNSETSSDNYELKAGSRTGAIVTVNRTAGDDETTFEFIVENRITTGAPGSRTIQYFNLELPECLDAPSFISDDGSFVDDVISWNKTISAPPSGGSSSNNSSTFSITYQGDIPFGEIDAEAVSGGSGQSYLGLIAGPACQSAEIELTFSGSAYVDANENDIKDPEEYGLEKITVTLFSLSDNAVETEIASTETDKIGEFSFNVTVPAGDYRIKVPANKVDNIYYQANTTSEDFINVTEDVKDIHFGYTLNVGQMTDDLLDGDIIQLNTEPVKYWDFQLQHAGVNQRQVDENPNVDFTRAQMIALLEKIEGLLPIVEIPFQFEGTGRNKINDALSILRGKKYDDPELSEFMVELLTAELNVANDFGALTPDGAINNPFNRAILIFGEAIACNALGTCPEGVVGAEGSLAFGKLIVGETDATANATVSDGTSLLRAFNGTGGIGSI